MSRSVKPDYESLRNRENTRKLESKVRVFQCRHIGCLRKIHSKRDWIILQPNGNIWGVVGTWSEAISAANGLAKIIASGGDVA